jgi:hypothetical protein
MDIDLAALPDDVDSMCIEMRWLGSGSVDSNKKSAGVQFVELLFLFRERCLLFHLA